MLGLLVELGPQEGGGDRAVALRVARVFSPHPSRRMVRPQSLKALSQRRLGVVRLTGQEGALAKQVARAFAPRSAPRRPDKSSLKALSRRRLGAVRFKGE